MVDSQIAQIHADVVTVYTTDESWIIQEHVDVVTVYTTSHSRVAQTHADVVTVYTTAPASRLFNLHIDLATSLPRHELEAKTVSYSEST